MPAGVLASPWLTCRPGQVPMLLDAEESRTVDPRGEIASDLMDAEYRAHRSG